MRKKIKIKKQGGEGESEMNNLVCYNYKLLIKVDMWCV